MRSLLSLLAATLTASALIGCDTSLELPTTTEGASSVANPGAVPSSVDPLELAICHAARREASQLIEERRSESAACVQDSDCTIAVAETACTGEIPAAINFDAEYAFLGFVARVDSRRCATVPVECAPVAAEDVVPLEVACGANRCAIVGE